MTSKSFGKESVFLPRSWRGVLDITLFVSDLRQVSGFLQVLQFPPPIKLTAMIIYPLHTFLHSVLVQDFVSGRAYCVNQYHYESL